MTFEAPGALLDERYRESTLDEIQAFGVTRVRALVYWRQFTASARSKSVPSFDTSNSNAYPASTWDRLDRLVASVQNRGMQLQMTLTGPVPTWATARKRGSTADPSARAVRPLGPRRGHALHGPGEPVVDLERAEPPELPRPAVQGRQARTRRSSTASSTSPARARSTARPATPATWSCSARPRRSATRTSSRRSASSAARCAWTRTTTKRKGCKKLRIDGYAHHAYTRKAGPTFVLDRSRRGQHRLARPADRGARQGGEGGRDRVQARAST